MKNINSYLIIIGILFSITLIITAEYEIPHNGSTIGIGDMNRNGFQDIVIYHGSYDG